ncbi:ESX-1 secretion-associated protein [Rhodococcus triatomae]|uniref:Excreted virulence factor EspC, type VII ESX diderm n=1 Tax=Rhodococcus triatomae TaxID=300028 RepID=A0A1G8KJC0_9NOCA|nr:type VII secretion target [Rhodococcus triatomae]QNG18943.1 ESX-1 secretion-associated protein [Rhodococcus triatomae]QNG25143.1 ESX-1 secretion-associated protein [Rhodococcus triatomae]SDI43494.1 Excreted virulence factor EspC, type VII ESX diderm [Rhodococcus triatomae]
MSDVTVETAGIRQFGASAAQSAEQITSAAGIDLAANLAALAPVLGPIGADFLASFATAQANHAKAVAELAAHYVATSSAAFSTADEYDGTDSGTADTFGGIGAGGLR